MAVCEGGLGVAVDAAKGNLSRGRLEAGDTVTLGTLGRLDVELGPLEEEFMSLKEGAVGVPPGSAADVVNISGAADGEDKCSSLDIVELLYVAGKDVNHDLGDASQDDAFNVTLGNGLSDLLIKPGCELAVIKVADGNIGAI